MSPEFKEFPKITRFYEQKVCVTEKIDGTNGLIWISEDLQTIKAGSRNRWLETTKEGDNYGFAKWVESNKEDLLKLGSGYHYGEWWGQGIQHGYGMKHKVFSLFNVNKWALACDRPDCCDVVPIIYDGLVNPKMVEDFSKPLEFSLAADRYGVECKKVEGVMMYFTKSGTYFKCPYVKGHK